MIENPGDLPRGNAWELQQARHRAAEQRRLRFRRASIFGAWILSVFAAVAITPPLVPGWPWYFVCNLAGAIVFWQMKDKWVA